MNFLLEENEDILKNKLYNIKKNTYIIINSWKIQHFVIKFNSRGGDYEK